MLVINIRMYNRVYGAMFIKSSVYLSNWLFFITTTVKDQYGHCRLGRTTSYSPVLYSNNCTCSIITLALAKILYTITHPLSSACTYVTHL